MKQFSIKVKEVLLSDEAASELVVTILMIVFFAIAAILTANFITTAAVNKAADVAACIEGSNSLSTKGSTDNCRNQDHSKTNSFKNDEEYKKRFG